MSIDVVTFGCRLNSYESEVMKREAEAAGLKDAILINTCAVTNEAVRQARQAVRKAKRDNPGASVIVTGCAAQTETETFSSMEEVDLVLGNTEKLERKSYQDVVAFGISDSEKVRVNDIMSVEETAGHLIDGLTGRARAFVQVQNGCDHRCTFCIIPYGRGNSRSAPIADVIEQTRRLVGAGHKEVVLTGVDITSYGADLEDAPTLGRLVSRLLDAVPDLLRLRLSSIDGAEVDEELLDRITGDERIAPHLHLSLQSGDNLILKRMKRRHTREQAIALCETIRARRPDTAFGADIIVGFPTETEAMFQRSLDIVGEAGLQYLHVFPYSPRKGTPAARMPQIPGGLAKERARRLRQAGTESLHRFLDSQIGKTFTAIQESGGRARLGNYAPVIIAGEGAPVGSALAVRITDRAGDALTGETA